MKKQKSLRKFYAMVAVGLALLLFSASALITANIANASENDPVFPQVDPTCLPGWYVNPDEADRIPDYSDAGMTFVGNDLVHHATNIPLADLEPGTFDSVPAPSLESFFSVEIINSDGTGYATLRYDTTGWYIGGPKAGTYDGHETDPANFIGKMSNWGEIADDSTVISFGVGYVNTPNDGTLTLVTSVSFAGQTYSLLCLPPTTEPTTPTTQPTTPTTELTTEEPTTEPTDDPTTEPTDDPTTDPTTEPTVTPTPTTSTSPIPVVLADDTLPVTGSPLAGLFAVGVLLIVIGTAALVIYYRNGPRKAKYASKH